MASTDQFETLINDISSEDRDTEAVADRIRILHAIRKFLKSVQADGHCASLLWLFDRNAAHSVYDCTLWCADFSNWPISVPISRLQNVTTRYQSMDIDAAIRKSAEDISHDSNGALSPLAFSKQFKQETGETLSEVIVELGPVDPDERERRFVGYLQILGSAETLSHLSSYRQNIIGKLIFNRISFGRRQRIYDAVEMFQGSIHQNHSEEEIIQAAVTCLQKYMISDRICIYNYKKNGGAWHCAERSPNTLKLPSLDRWIQPFIDIRMNESPLKDVVRVRDFFESADQNDFSPYFKEVADQSPVPTDPPKIAVMLIPIHAGEPQSPPLATLKLIVAAQDDFIGGTFSETDQQICQLIANYLSHLLPGVITQTRTETISKHLAEDQAIASDQIEDVQSVYQIFPQLLVETCISAKKSWAYSVSLDNNENQTIEWVSDQGQTTQNPLSLSNAVLNAAAEEPQLLQEGEYLHCETAVDLEGEVLRLYWTTEHREVPFHDRITAKQLAADMRLRAFGKLDVRELIRQATELRHAVKASMMGVVGSTHLLNEIYYDAREQKRADRDTEIFERALFRKTLIDLTYSVDVTNRFLESVRVVKKALTADDLKFSQLNPTVIAERIIRMMKGYAETRAVTVNITKRYLETRELWPFFDPLLMQVALTNIIENAIKYARRDTFVKIEFGIQKDFWTFTVEDRGRWIPDNEDIDRIFEGARLETFSGETGQAGTGMGLPAVRRIIRAHDSRSYEIVSSQKIGGSSESAPTAITSIGFSMPRSPKKDLV